MAKNKRIDAIKCKERCEVPQNMCPLFVWVQNIVITLEIVLWAMSFIKLNFIKLNIHLSYGSEIPLVKLYPREL